MVRKLLNKIKNKFKSNEESKKKFVTWITIISFLSAYIFMAFKDSREAEASAVSLAGWFLESSRGIAGAYLPSTGKIYVNIGWKLTADYHLYEFDPNTFDSLQQNPATFDNNYQYPFAAAGTINNYIYFLGGGVSQTYGPSDKIFRFTPNNIEIVGHLPYTLVAPASAVYNGAIYMAGGISAWSSSKVIYNAVLKYDGQNVQTVGYLPIALYDAGADFTPDGKMIIFGGRAETGDLNSIIQFDPQTGESTQIGTLPRSCSGIRAARVDDIIYVFIPGDSSNNKTEIYEFKDGQLNKLDISISERLSQTCAVTAGKKIFLFCGRDPYTATDSNKIWCFDTTLIPPGKASVSITQDGNNITLSWDPVTHAVSYHIEHSTDNTNWAEIEITNETSYSGRLDKPGIHYYRVRGESEGGELGEYSNVVSVTIKPLPPALQAVVDGKTVSLSWQAVPDASSYVVQRSTDGSTWTQIAEVSGTSYTDTNTSWNMSYYYRVLSKTSEGVTSDPSNAVQVTTSKIPAPTNLKASLSGTKVSLIWDTVSGASSYLVERSLDGQKWTTIATVTGTSYVDQNTQPNTVYYYRVRSQCSTSVSDPSNTVAVQTFENPPPPPAVVSGLTAVWTGDKVTVTWNRGQNQLPDGEIELWKQGTNGVWLPVKTLSASERDSFTWDDTMIAPGQNYRYELRYLGGLSTGYTWYKFAESGWATGDRPYSAPSGLRLTVGLNSATISWEAVSGATSYTIQYSTDGGTNWQSLNVTGTSATVPRHCIARVRAGSHPRSQWSGIVTVN